MTKKVKFDADFSETFANSDGDIFEFNYERAQYLSQDIYAHYTQTLEKHAKKFKKSKKDKTQQKHALNLIALRDEWCLGDDNTPEDTLYCIWSKNNEDVWTDITTDNELYSWSFLKILILFREYKFLLQ